MRILKIKRHHFKSLVLLPEGTQGLEKEVAAFFEVTASGIREMPW